MNPGPPPPNWRGCSYCFASDHLFGKCSYRTEPHAVDFFHAYMKEFVPEVYAKFNPNKPTASVPFCLPAPMASAPTPASTALVPSPAKKTRFGPSPYARTFVTQIVHSFESAVVSPSLLNPMPLPFTSLLPHLTLQLLPGVTVPMLYDTCSGVNLLSSAMFLWIQYIAPSAILAVYDREDSHYPFAPIHVSGVTSNPADFDVSDTPGCLSKVVVLRTRHLMSHEGATSPLLLTFGVGSDVNVNACLGISTIRALDLVYFPASEAVRNDALQLSFPCSGRQPDPPLPLPSTPLAIPPACLSPAMEVHLLHQRSGPVLTIPHVTETNSADGVVRECSFGLAAPDCHLPPITSCSPTGCIYTLISDATASSAPRPSE